MANRQNAPKTRGDRPRVHDRQRQHQSVATTKDGGQGASEAFGYTASVTGTATNLNVYLDSTSGEAGSAS